MEGVEIRVEIKVLTSASAALPRLRSRLRSCKGKPDRGTRLLVEGGVCDDCDSFRDGARCVRTSIRLVCFCSETATDRFIEETGAMFSAEYFPKRILDEDGSVGSYW